MRMTQEQLDKLLETHSFQPRRPYEDDKPEGYLESDNDFIANNLDLVVAFLNHLDTP